MKTLNELADELKEAIIDMQSDSYNRNGIKRERYNNLKLGMEPARNKNPHVVVTMAISSAEYDLKSLEKNSGGLGPEEKYVLRWFGKTDTLPALMECWKAAEDVNVDQIKKEMQQSE